MAWDIRNILINIKGDIEDMKKNFAAGVDSVYNAVVSAGGTPASKSLADVVAAIETLSSGSEVQKLYQGIGHIDSAYSETETFTILEDGCIVITGYDYTSSSMITINGGSNVLEEVNQYYFTAPAAVIEVKENDTVTFTIDTVPPSDDYINIYFVPGGTIPTLQRRIKNNG